MSAYYVVGYNQQSFTVRLDRKPKPITDPHLRFARHIKTVESEEPTPCRVWTGSAAFNFGDGRTVTPKRAAMELAEIDWPSHKRLRMRCKTPNCVALSHIIFDEL